MRAHHLGAALLAAALGGCGPATQPGVVYTPPAPSLHVAASDVTPGDPWPGEGTLVVVNATEPRTRVGHFQAGQRVRIAVIDAQWTNAPGPTLFGAAGVPGKHCESDGGHRCIGGDGPLMGLILVLQPAAQPEPAAQGAVECVVQNRLMIPNGVEFSVPFDAEINLGPNDWEDGCSNNSGAISVEVERASGPKEKALEKRSLSVSAVAPRTFAGRFARGEYLRVTVTGGKWNNDPGAASVGAEGVRGQTCGSPGHVCVGADNQPLMGLVLLMSACRGAPQRPAVRPATERRFIPDGADFVLEHEADVFLAPNDREDGLSDNSGSVRVKVTATDK